MDLSRQALASLRASLEAWHRPPELQSFFQDFRAETDKREFFNKGGLSFLREAMVAADFGIARDASGVRLVPAVEERPDFELSFDDGRIERFEMMEADQAGRRRGAEYKARQGLSPGSTHSIYAPLDDEIIEMVRRAAHKKAKYYPPGTRLLIYLNAFRCAGSEGSVDLFPDAVAAARPFFETIWVIWSRSIYLVASAA